MRNLFWETSKPSKTHQSQRPLSYNWPSEQSKQIEIRIAQESSLREVEEWIKYDVPSQLILGVESKSKKLISLDTYDQYFGCIVSDWKEDHRTEVRNADRTSAKVWFAIVYMSGLSLVLGYVLLTTLFEKK